MFKMIKIDNIEVAGFDTAIRGMRNAMDSHHLSDSREYIYMNAFQSAPFFFEEVNKTLKYIGGHAHIFELGPNDKKLASGLVLAGTDEAKFARQIYVGMDITASLYWWKEADTYKIGTAANSESTMHKLHSKPITKDMFSFDEELKDVMYWVSMQYEYLTSVDKDVDNMLYTLETLRKLFLETKDKRYWRALIQLLPSAWNQKRTWTANYQVLRNIYFARRNHKLAEWRDFCTMIEKLPYASDLITISKE